MITNGRESVAVGGVMGGLHFRYQRQNQHDSAGSRVFFNPV